MFAKTVMERKFDYATFCSRYGAYKGMKIEQVARGTAEILTADSKPT